MLLATLLVSVLLLVVVNLLLRLSRYTIPGIPILCLLSSGIAPGYFNVDEEVLGWQCDYLAGSAFLLILLVIRFPLAGKKLFLALSCLVIFVPNGLLLYSTLGKRAKVIETYEAYHFQSLEERLPTRIARPPSVPKDQSHLDWLEKEVSKASNGFDEIGYVMTPRDLHDESVKVFVARPGFGRGRAIVISRSPPTPEQLKEHNDSIPLMTPVHQADYFNPALQHSAFEG
jgi:hypothetical protein